MDTNMPITRGDACGKKVIEEGFSGSNFSKVAGKKDAANSKMTPIMIVSMEHAAARHQKPANAGRGGNAETSRTAGMASGGEALCGT
jgi:hypothetical protein